MKNSKALVLVGGAIAMGAYGVYSFTNDTNPQLGEMKKYEVIRMVDGELATFDTTITANSTYTAEDYLADLGFENDEHVNIIDFTQMGSNTFTFSGEDGHEHGEMIVIEMDDENVGEFHPHHGDHDIVIEKHIMKIDSGNGEEITVNVDVQGLLDEINIDSIIAAAMEGHEGDSNEVFIKKMIVSDERVEGGEGTVEWESIDAIGADVHHEIHGPNHHMEIAMWGEGEDMTMVIISDPANSPENKTMVVDENNREVPMFKLFPNPATSEATLELNFEDKAPTNITITDMAGKVVAEMNLGDFQGKFTHQIQTASWEKGVYIVQTDHGAEKIIEKLIVE